MVGRSVKVMMMKKEMKKIFVCSVVIRNISTQTVFSSPQLLRRDHWNLKRHLRLKSNRPK
eukprot:89864-Hanusia_phi.AAC.1